MGDVGGIATPQSSKGGSKKGSGSKGTKEKGEAGEKRERGGSKEPKKEVHKSPDTLARETKEKERKQALKAMTPQARAEHFASAKMFDRYNKQE